MCSLECLEGLWRSVTYRQYWWRMCISRPDSSLLVAKSWDVLHLKAIPFGHQGFSVFMQQIYWTSSQPHSLWGSWPESDSAMARSTGSWAKVWAELRGNNKGWLSTLGLVRGRSLFYALPLLPWNGEGGNHAWIPERVIAATQAADMEEDSLPEVGWLWEEELRQQRKNDNKYILFPPALQYPDVSIGRRSRLHGWSSLKVPLPGAQNRTGKSGQRIWKGRWRWSAGGLSQE